MTDFDIIIIGAGAAGLMCAGVAQNRGRRVLVLDHGPEVGRKIRISGGGRCNFTNRYASPANYLSENPHFCVSALKRYPPQAMIDWVERSGIAYHERDHGQLFCDGSARQIVEMLLRPTEGAEVRTSVSVASVAKTAEGFAVETVAGAFTSASLVVATGGPSIPKMGASGFGYDIARQFGLRVIPQRPGLVPLTFGAETLARLHGLAGISLTATVSLGKTRFTEALLFTHRGLSGPVILQISSFWREGEALTIDLWPGVDAFALLKQAKGEHPRKEASTVLSHLLPKRLATRMAEWAGAEGRLADTSDKTLRHLADMISAWRITPNGSEGNATAEVTVGGVDTRELSSQTLEVKAVPGLYFIGEVVDVTGHLGGFNFQWAWASGRACGQVA